MAEPNSLDYSRAGRPFPFLRGKVTPTDFDYSRAGRPFVGFGTAAAVVIPSYVLSGTATAAAATGSGVGVVYTDPPPAPSGYTADSDTLNYSRAGRPLVFLRGKPSTLTFDTSRAGRPFPSVQPASAAGAPGAYTLSGTATASAATGSGVGLVVVNPVVVSSGTGIFLLFGAGAAAVEGPEPTGTAGVSLRYTRRLMSRWRRLQVKT